MTNETVQKLTPSQKLEARFNDWMSARGVKFASPQIERVYKQRVQLFKDAIQLRKPERVPVCPNIGFFPMAYAGITAEEAMYDYDKLGMALKKYNTDFEADALNSCLIFGPGKMFEILDYKLYRWPGHGVPPKAPYQCRESDYMLADEYDLFITDPSDYFLRRYLPRIFGALGPWQKLAPLTDILELPFTGGVMVPIGLPDVQEAFTKLQEAGRAALEWIQAAVAIDLANIGSLGLPPWIGGFTKAPFDTLGDTLRGTHGIMQDKFRQPEKVIEAMERFVPLAIDMGVRNANTSGNPLSFIPLHKGADGFMSIRDFKTFYWPTLKAVILGLIKEGIVPLMFVEGSYNQRLDIIADPDIPEGTTLWLFDKSDMVEVKKKLGGWACIAGNVPASMLKTSKPEEVKAYVRRLIENVAQDGGFILGTGAVTDDATPENLHALIDAGREYGAYR